uniref:cysteine-S-conjugate beta-lyase n=1 Tax=Albugo laibachii Nc14 TaxID=890382 RepID=F0WJP0_9STRA|nr:unnamed protein product [Albugo laibachii Nc14]|eukprot:CCA21490.1 unnamed protein product [Albugo laibachii Nc14]
MALNASTFGASSGDVSRQNVGETEVFDLVCDYLRTRQFFQAEQILRDERARVIQHPNSIENSHPNQKDASEKTSALASRLESMLERSYVTQIVSGDSESMEKIFVPRHEIVEESEIPRGIRSDLNGCLTDLNLSMLSDSDNTDETELAMDTKLVHFNPCSDDPHGAATMPIYQTSTFAQPSATTFSLYDYTRSGNPTRAALERQMAELEGGCRSFAFTSGMAALSAVSRLATSGDEIILSDDSYGGTYRLLSQIVSNHNITVKYVDLSGENGAKNLSNVISPTTKLVMMESPTNPMQRICDIHQLSIIAHRHNALLSVDNTMMSPILQNPIALGADIVIHSATKFIGGHSDTMAGIVIAKSHESAREIYFYQNAEGTGLAPFDCFLILRGIKTMSLRVLKAQENAIQIASYLHDHPQITQVYFPQLLPQDSIQRHTHEAQARGPGSVLCFRTGSLLHSQHIVSVTKLFKITVSFGSVNSLISLPGAMSHASIPEEVRKARAFPEDLIRIAIGVEDPKDLIRDLSQAIQSYESGI